MDIDTTAYIDVDIGDRMVHSPHGLEGNLLVACGWQQTEELVQ